MANGALVIGRLQAQVREVEVHVLDQSFVLGFDPADDG